MKKVKSLDGYDLFEIEEKVYLADHENYKKDIDKIISNLDDLKFDSIIICFGLDTGEYLKYIEEVVCIRNRILIFEPNEEVFNSYTNEFENVVVVKYDESILESILINVINGDNFDNLYVNAFGNYEKIYKKEYEKLLSKIDSVYITINGNIVLSYMWKEAFLRNSLSNLKIISESTPISSYELINKDVPAIIVSAGPSLDKNIKDMVSNIDKVKNTFVIASNRTMSMLIKNGIEPDLVVSIDPADVMYDMMKENLNSEVPLLFYEYSNRNLINNYKGNKIYVPNIFFNTLEGFEEFGRLSQGGSVAHTCIAMANLLGCNPIILVGQDLAYTNGNHHSNGAKFDIDNSIDHTSNIEVKDVFGNMIKSTYTLDGFKNWMEKYIKEYKKERRVEFINVSYGADIEGAPHKELVDVLNECKSDSKIKLQPDRCINIDYKAIVKEISDFIQYYLKQEEQGETLCRELMYVKKDKSLLLTNEDDIDMEKFYRVISIVNSFEADLENTYLGGYFSSFMYEIKRESFSMLAKDYEELTSSMRYQGKMFLKYFKKMKKMLLEALKIVKDEVINL